MNSGGSGDRQEPGGPGARGGAAAGGAPGPDAYLPHPDAELLDSVVIGALRCLDGLRPQFRLPADVATAADPNTTLKPLGELAELSDVIRTRHPSPLARELADGLFRFAWKQTGDGELFAELVRGEPQATYPVELYGVFARTGLRHPGTDELIGATTSLRRWRLAQEDHTRTLSVLNAERRAGLRPHADFDAVLGLTGLGLLPEPWALDRKAVYGVTHDVFHVTDWGRAAGRLPAPLADYLRLWVPAWLATWREERLWDLAGELLAISACLPGGPYDPAAWRQLAAAQGGDGAVPETGDPPPEGAGPGEVFTACYHSTLVTAFAATLARTAAPAPGVPGRTSAAHARGNGAGARAAAAGPAATPLSVPIRESEATS